MALFTTSSVVNALTYPVGTPKGTFSVTPSGAANYAIDIDMPVGVGGMQPTLAINYNSQSGDGFLGVGCSLSGMSSISRGPKDIYHDGFAKGVSYDASDAFYLDGKRLIPDTELTTSAQTVYTVESDPFTKVTLTPATNLSGSYFRVTASNGMSYEYGNTTDSRFDVSQGITYAWYLNKATDSRGNYITYNYMHSDNFVYPSGINYGMNESGAGVFNTITFTYENRTRDARPFYIRNTHGSISKRLKTITTATATQVYRVYDLAYNDQNDNHSRLVSITERNGAGEALKPVALTWDYLQTDSRTPRMPNIQLQESSSFLSFSDRNFLSQDLNGDGIDDIIQLSSANEYAGGNSYNHLTCAFINLSNVDADGISYDTPFRVDFNPSFSFDELSCELQGAANVDFDGDGKADLALPFVLSENISNTGHEVFNIQIALGKNLAERRNGVNTFAHAISRTGGKTNWLIADFNNDGKSEIFYIEGKGANNYYQSVYAWFPNGLEGNNPLSSIETNLFLPKTPKSMQQGDFNSDGLTDIIVFFEDSYRVYFNSGVAEGEYPFSYSNSVGGTTIQDVPRIYSGDFNGDGALDFITNADTDSRCYFVLGNNDGTFNKIQAYSLDGNLIDKNTDEDDSRFTFLITDFDNDGRSDVIMAKSRYVYHSNLFYDYYSYASTIYSWQRSTGSTLSEVQRYNVTNDEDGSSSGHFQLGNFSGLGKTEILSFGRDFTSADSPTTPALRIIDSGFSPTDGKVTTITDGMGRHASINYATITDPQIYSKGTGAQYPLQDCLFPFHVVSSVTSSFEQPDNVQTNYTYGGLKCHLQGKGLLGFTTMESEDETRGIIETLTLSDWDATRYLPLTTTLTTEQGVTTRSSVRHSMIVGYANGNYKQYENSVNTCDIYGNQTQQTYLYDTSHNYLTRQKTLDVSTGSYKQTDYSDHQIKGGVYLPTNVVFMQKHSDNPEIFEQRTRYTYTDDGLVSTITEHYDTPKYLQTAYTYDCYGNKLTETVSGEDITTQQTSYSYNTCRFPSQVLTQPAATDIRYTYDIWGNVLTVSDHTYGSVLQTQYGYDGWGNRNYEVSPEGLTTTISLSRVGGTSNDYKEQIETEGLPSITTWYDHKGRKVRTESVGVAGTLQRQLWTYNSLGLLQRETQTIGNLSKFTTYTYDTFGRKTTETRPNGQVFNYTYGNRSEAVETNGQSTVRTFDAWGNLKTAEDPLSSVAYIYGANGKPRYVHSGGATWEFEYDDAGNKTLLSDPDAGDTEYEYDALGRIVYQRDARGIETETEYDVHGHIASITIDGSVTTFSYGNTGNVKMRLFRESNADGTATYSYDPLGRVISSVRSLTGTGAYNTVTYSYNNLNQLSSKTINGQREEYSYDANGYKVGSSINGQNVWQLVGYNGLRMTKLLGDSLTSITEYSVNGVTRKAVLKGEETITDINYDYTTSNGNIASRTGMIDDEETFTYDELDRLVSVSVDDQDILEMDYEDNGNLSDKTGLGSISYNSAHPHAVSLIECTPSDYYVGLQTTAYNALNKIERIAHDNKTMTFVYGPDCTRWKSTFTSGSSTRTILYGNDYERITKNATTRHFHYLDEGTILMTIAGQSDQLLFSCTDNLGSIVKLVDKHGNAVFEATYDVWGKQAVTRNEIGFHRGYTGHEMLPAFNLINMNGRLYDPVVGRFLSPDNFVQLEDFSQNFNRYSYCLNNPLKYTDPSGEFVWWPLLVGGVMNLVANSDNIHGFWHGVSLFATGAVSAVTGPFFSPMVLGMGNSVLNQGFTNGWNHINAESVLSSTVVSFTTSIAGGTLGNYLSKPIGSLTSRIANPILKNSISSAITNSLIGFGVGTTFSLLKGNSSKTAFTDGYNAAKLGIVSGAISGTIEGAKVQKQNAQATTPHKPLHRPYLRKQTREAILASAYRGPNGEILDTNTLEPIVGPYDIGHVYGFEFRKLKAFAEYSGMTQKQFNDFCNNPSLYQIENPSLNRGHYFEMPGNSIEHLINKF